ncbi:MAG TPA: phosphatidylglycerol lysyltransferase domain-containing protein, partial [Gammaproteobacteria bacterium]|nr:phosphatidylglycerol lysyltransferase domain-containing protein [Gammaproteobacteria bacterium]
MSKFAHIWCAVFVLVSSIIILLPHPHHLLHLRGSDFFTLHVSSLVLGFLAFYFSLQLFRRKKLAHRIVLLIVAGLFVSGILHGHHLWKLSMYGACLLLLTGYAKAFTVKSNNLNIGRALVASLVVFGCSILYGAIGFYTIESRAFGIDLSVWQSVKYALLQLVLFDNAIVAPLTRQGHMFVLSLDFISIAGLLLVVSNLFRPIHFKFFSDNTQQKTAELLITQNSVSVEDFFLLWPRDKHYFFNQDRTAVIAYKVQSGVAFALDGPRGDKKEFSELLKAFGVFSEQNGWLPAFIHTGTEMKDLISALGFKALFIGNEAMIDIPSFTEKTVRGKHFRYIENKAKREGLTVEFWDPPLSALQIAQLRAVSESWLAIPGRREYTFIMGYFDSNYISNSEVAVLKSR